MLPSKPKNVNGRKIIKLKQMFKNYLQKTTLLILMFFSSIAMYGQDLYFTIDNNSDYELYGVHISPYHDGISRYDWSDDLYPDATFSPGSTTRIHVPADWYTSYCTFAVKITYYGVDKKFYEQVVCQIDVCKEKRLELINGRIEFLDCWYK